MEKYVVNIFFRSGSYVKLKLTGEDNKGDEVSALIDGLGAGKYMTLNNNGFAVTGQDMVETNTTETEIGIEVFVTGKTVGMASKSTPAIYINCEDITLAYAERV